MNGTYADFRPKLVERVKRGFYGKSGNPEARIQESEAMLAGWDAKWAAIPHEEKLRARAEVVEGTTPKPKLVKTDKGMITLMVREPSDNPALKRRKRISSPSYKPKRRHPGDLTNEDNPLLTLEPSLA